MSSSAMFFTHQKRITERNSHIVGEPSESSSSNGGQTKIEHHSTLAEVVIYGEHTKICATALETSIQAFLVTAAPWKFYFTDNPRIIPSFYLWSKKELYYLITKVMCNFLSFYGSAPPTLIKEGTSFDYRFGAIEHINSDICFLPASSKRQHKYGTWTKCFLKINYYLRYIAEK